MRYILINIQTKQEHEFFSMEKLEEFMYKERKNKNECEYKLITYIPDYKAGTISKTSRKLFM